MRRDEGCGKTQTQTTFDVVPITAGIGEVAKGVGEYPAAAAARPMPS